MELSATIEALLRLPRTFRSVGSKSVVALLEESGYAQKHAEISVERIRQALAEHPEYAEDWIGYSEDKRTDSGWYIIQSDDQPYIVGYLHKRHRRSKADEEKYDDRLQACAVFIKHEIEEIRSA